MARRGQIGVPRPRIVSVHMTEGDVAALRARVHKAKRRGYKLVQVNGDVLMAALKEIETWRRRWPGAN